MDKDELIKFLKENLEINVVHVHAERGDGEWTNIEISLCGEVIDSTELSG